MISIFVVSNFVKGEQFGDHCCFVHPRKRKAKNLRLHYMGNDMLSNDKLRYFDFTTHLLHLQPQSPQFSAILTSTTEPYFCVCMIMEFFNFNYGQENTFTLSPFRSWKMDVTIIQVSKNFNTHHNFSFSRQEVRFLLIILLAHFIFLSDV